MKLMQLLKEHRLLFGGLSGLTVILHVAIIVWLFLCVPSSRTGILAQVPEIAWIAIFACLPILSGTTSTLLAFLIAKGLKQPWIVANCPRIKIYIACFTVFWLIVFGYLAFFHFIMGLGAQPGPSTMQEFINRVISVLVTFPLISVISLVVCTIATFPIALMCEISIWSVSKILKIEA